MTTTLTSLLADCLTIGALASSAALADSRNSTSGYASDKGGNIVRSGSGGG